MSSVGEYTLDSILIQVGEFGKYQLFSFVLVCIAVVLHSATNVAYTFTALSLDYRCYITGCDSGNGTEYSPSWLSNAVPYSDGEPENCEKYVQVNYTNSTYCPSSSFDTSSTENCESYVYKTSEVSVIQDFDIHCDSNTWKLSLVGTINSVGLFVGIPTTGFLSDRYGRKNVLVVGLILCSLCGIIRSFANTYILFLVLEFLDAAFGAGSYALGFILAVELVGPSKRVCTSTIVCCSFAFGEILVAAVAWALQSWRPLLLAIYTPILIVIFYHWLAPESVRWLLSQKRYDEAKAILKKAAKVNGRAVSDETLEKLCLIEEEEKPPFTLIFEVRKSRVLVLRVLISCFCWITCTFSFYGLTLNSVDLAGNSYLDFIYSALAEIPGYLLVYFLIDRIGRKISLIGSFFVTGVACIACIFIPSDLYAAQLPVYLIGKFGATAAFTICYVVTSEIFPTPLRSSLLGTCSMVGRIGNMLAPQSKVLSQVWGPLPLTLFGSFALISAFLSLFFPETLNLKLPDTIEEAENIGKKEKEANVEVK